jgi:hypothetical protein
MCSEHAKEIHHSGGYLFLSTQGFLAFFDERPVILEFVSEMLSMRVGFHKEASQIACQKLETETAVTIVPDTRGVGSGRLRRYPQGSARGGF